MFELATAALLSCSEAQAIINRIDSTDFSRREYRELVSTVSSSAPRRCRIVAKPTLYRGQVKRIRRQQQRQWNPHQVVVRPTIYWSW